MTIIYGRIKHNHSINILLSSIILLLIIFFNIYSVSAEENQPLKQSPIIDITKNIQYEWANNIDENLLKPVWLDEQAKNVSWKDFNGNFDSIQDYHKPEALVRVKLPEGKWSETSLSFKCYTDELNIYLGDKLLYSGIQNKSSEKYIDDFPYHIIQLEEGYAGKYLFFEIKSNISQKDRLVSEIKIGAKSSLIFDNKNKVSAIVKNEIDYMILSALFISLGIVLVLLYVFRKTSQKAFPFLGFSSLCIGFWVLCENNIISFFINDKYLTTFIATLAIELLPVGFVAFIEEMLIQKRKLYFKILKWAILVWTAVTIFLGASNIMSMILTIKVYHVLLVVTIVLVLLTVIIYALKGNTEAKVYAAGFILISAAGVVDVIDMFYKPIPFLIGWHLTPWAMFVFVALLLYILAKRIERMNNTLKVYSKEIETKNGELEAAWLEIAASRDELADLNKTLESKVHKRTMQLEDANDELSALNEQLTALNEELTATMDDLQQTQAQLIISDKMATLGNLVAGVAHEINTPLGSILSNVQMELMLIESLDQKDNESVSTFVDSVTTFSAINKEALSRIVEIVKNLKNFARLDEAELKEVNIHDGLNSTLMLVNYQLKSIKLETEYGEIPPVTCFPQQLNQVFLNILVNAIQAIQGENGRIKIKTEYKNQKVLISFEDTGSGIKPDKIGRIFDPGFTTKGVGVGTGLGLSISYKIIQKHHGYIKVESTVGVGTKFTIELPVSAV